MNSRSDKTIRNILITGLIAMIIILSLFALTAYSLSGGVLVGGRMNTVIYSPSPLGSPPWECPSTPCPPPGDLQQRQIGPEYVSNTLADVTPYSPKSSSQYIYLLIPKGHRYCPNPRTGAFFIGRGIPVGPGGNALLMEIIGCSR